ncbi:hypothetical protein APY94_05140 [Thermococcus celericrescens]|uniref:DUF4405 domain-containing protein n=2 Tax=Thermococcus TaxID=2263 RepID=A0A100XY47_9EURY|nr:MULTISPECIES: hypothetical protein [Thermococcus]KUH33581.1 hypothetical protein APY94_05140 [Thermococcus celericrescens]QEK14390.1 hypothetical protein FPV09_03890 [Thermococcus aciditolerans]
MDPMAEVFEKAKKNPQMRKKLRIKAIFSMTLFIAFLGVIFITIGTFISAKQGTFLGMNQLDFLKLRARYGLVMMVLIIIHLIMNRSIMKKELELLTG